MPNRCDGHVAAMFVFSTILTMRMTHLPSLYYFTELLSVISETSEPDSTAAAREETGEEYCKLLHI